MAQLKKYEGILDYGIQRAFLIIQGARYLMVIDAPPYGVITEGDVTRAYDLFAKIMGLQPGDPVCVRGFHYKLGPVACIQIVRLCE